MHFCDQYNKKASLVKRENADSAELCLFECGIICFEVCILLNQYFVMRKGDTTIELTVIRAQSSVCASRVTTENWALITDYFGITLLTLMAMEGWGSAYFSSARV